VANRSTFARACVNRPLLCVQFRRQPCVFARHNIIGISFGISGFRSTEIPAPSRAWAGHAFRLALRIPLRSTGTTFFVAAGSTVMAN
jgi:hypothetical protein